MSERKPNIVFFWWDNFAWGELGRYGGGVLRGAPTPRIDRLASEGLRLLNSNVEAQCTPSRSAIMTGRHPVRSETQTIPITGGFDGLTRWETTNAQALSDAGYATGMWGKWHLGSDPHSRSPIDFGFDESIWNPRTADEVFWTTQSYFPNGDVTATPYAGNAKIKLEPQPIYSRKKGGAPQVIATYDAEFRANFDRQITQSAIDFMTRATKAGKPFHAYLPYTQVHIPPIHDPEFAGKTKRGGMADVLTRMDYFSGQILDTLDALGVTNDSIVIWSSDNGADPNWRLPAMDPDPLGAFGPAAPARGAAAILQRLKVRTEPLASYGGPAKRRPVRLATNSCMRLIHSRRYCSLPAPKFPTIGKIDGMDMREFFFASAEQSGRDTILHFNGSRLQGIKWRNWKAHLFKQDEFMSTWKPLNEPHLFNLEWDLREEHQCGFPHAWVAHPMAAAVMAFMKTLVLEPPIKPGTRDPYTPPKPGELRPEEHIQIGAILQFVTALAKTVPEAVPADVGVGQQGG